MDGENEHFGSVHPTSMNTLDQRNIHDFLHSNINGSFGTANISVDLYWP